MEGTGLKKMNDDKQGDEGHELDKGRRPGLFGRRCRRREGEVVRKTIALDSLAGEAGVAQHGRMMGRHV